jgi:hypothetical protein
LPRGTPGSGSWQLHATSGSPELGTIERWSIQLGGATFASRARALIPEATACVRAHRANAAEVQLAVETTHDEIVAVDVIAGAGALADCLVEATWAVRLDARFERDDQDFVVVLGR